MGVYILFFSPVGCVISSDFSAPGILFGLEEVNPNQPQRNLIKLEIPQFPTLPLPDVLTVETVGGLPDFISAIAFGRLPAPVVPAMQANGVVLLLLLIVCGCFVYRRRVLFNR